MSAVFRGKGRFGYIYVPWSKGRAVELPCGTPDRHVIKRMERLVADLKDDRRWALLDAVVARQCSLGRLYDAHVANALDALEHELKAVDLTVLVDAWIADYLANGKSATNAPTYERQVRSFVGERFLSHELTTARVKAWIGGMDDVSSGTKRNRLMAVRSFVAYCVEVGALPANPLRDFTAPKKNPPSMRYESQETDEAIVAATEDVRYKALFAFIHATGADLSPVLAHTLRSDIDLDRGVARLRGTKTAKRHVHEAIIEPWALPALWAYLGTMMPHVKPWDGITRYMSAWFHAKAAEAACVKGYTLRMARHSVAVRARRAGRSFEWIAAQLGNTVYQVATVYAAFRLTTEERLDTERDTERENGAPNSRGRRNA